MTQIRILHSHEPGFPWDFTSPDVPELVGGGDATYALSQAHAEDVVRWHLFAEAEERGEPAPDLEFEHFVNADAAAVSAAA